MNEKNSINSHSNDYSQLDYYDYQDMESYNIGSKDYLSKQQHTVAIWTFTFHKILGFVRVILKANFKPVYKPVS